MARSRSLIFFRTVLMSSSARAGEVTPAVSIAQRKTTIRPRIKSLLGRFPSPRPRDRGAEDAYEYAFDDEGPAHERVRGADELHDLDLVTSRVDRDADGVHDDEQRHEEHQPQHRDPADGQYARDGQDFVHDRRVVDD